MIIFLISLMKREFAFDLELLEGAVKEKDTDLDLIKLNKATSSLLKY